MNPGPLTLRELLWMVDGRGRAEWAHTSSVLAMLANQNLDPKKRSPYKPKEFNPYLCSKETAFSKTADLSILKKVFVDGKKPKPGGKRNG